MRPIALLFACLLLTAAAPGMAQQPAPAPAPKPPPSAFSQLFSSPTGKNGYEELVLAGDLVKSSRLFRKAEEGPTTLRFKREVLLDRSVIKALALVRAGVSKPIFSPRQTLSVHTLLPELAEFRSLARLLRLQQYVFMADGRTSDAIQNARLCLQLGRVIQTDTLISGLVGVAISSICIQSMGQHLDQLSAKDCELLYRVCLEWLTMPSMDSAMMEAERRGSKVITAELIDDVKKSGVQVLKGYLDSSDSTLVSEAEGMLGGKSPEELDRIGSEAVRLMDGVFDQVQVELRKPVWARKRGLFKPEEQPGAAGWLVSKIMPTLELVGDRYSAERARVQLLACHCAIRRYRWEQERLPENLAALNVGELALDPFTGEPLKYVVNGTRYTLSSAGAPAPPTDERAVDGRIPVSVGPN